MKFLVSLLFVISFACHASPIKIGHMGIVAHDSIARILSDGSHATVVGYPGGKGVVAFNALAGGDVDFLIVTGSSLFVSPIVHRDVYKFAPIDKFRVISVFAVSKPVLVLPKQYQTVDQLVADRCSRTPLYVAGTSEKSQLLVEIAFASTGCKLIIVPYSSQNTALVDLSAGRIDLAVTVQSTARLFADRTSSVLLSSIGSDTFLNSASFGSYLVTRRDVSKQQIADVLALFERNLNSERATAFARTNEMTFVNITGTQLDKRLEQTSLRYRLVLDKQK